MHTEKMIQKVGFSKEGVIKRLSGKGIPPGEEGAKSVQGGCLPEQDDL